MKGKQSKIAISRIQDCLSNIWGIIASFFKIKLWLFVIYCILKLNLERKMDLPSHSQVPTFHKVKIPKEQEVYG